MERKILFLGYDGNQTLVPKWLRQFGAVTATSGRVASLAGYDSVVVYGYRHILQRDLLETASTPPINLHISYLPFNRGAHPNFWCWIEKTPAGVTIHEVDAGVDTGPVVAQQLLGPVDNDATFEDTYWQLRQLVERVFFNEYARILDRDYASTPQDGLGSFHRSSELPEWVSWKMTIKSALERYSSDYGK
ncbi:MAG: formyltransferase family protein [Rhodobacteraceae bacterium]|nr:formyltransferase family protein [Paracoccaceae bacterium]